MLEIVAVLIIFLIFFGIGFILIYKQVALVKKGEFSFKDRLQCLIYGFLFSMGIMVVVSMGFIFADNTLNPLILIIPLFICILYVSIYPLIDFLYIALSEGSDEGLTPFHRILSHKLINISNKKHISIPMAVMLYMILIIPPILLSLVNLPFSMLWISWMLFYPLLILNYYGTKGYIAGISNQYYHIPEMKRYLFLNFEDQKRGMQQFISNPTPFIVFGMMLFVFVWAWISLIQTILFFFTGSLAISTMSSYFVYVTLFFGIIGYFTRFWGRKIKYRGIDIYFAAYLMAAIGINVLVNFLLVNIDVLSNAFNVWAFTKEITTNNVSFSWAAIIEESILISFTSYFLISKKNEFKFNVKYSIITECGQKFDPIPLFTLLKNQDPILSKHAEKTLLLMFERIPLKSKSLLNDWKFKSSLMDGICDYNINSQRVCLKILIKLIKDAPDIVISWFIEALKSPNYDKRLPFAKTLLSSKLAQEIPLKVFKNLLRDDEWRSKKIGIELTNKLLTLKPSMKLRFESDLWNLIDDEDPVIQTKVLKLICDAEFEKSQKLLFTKLKSPNQKIQATAIDCLSKVKKVDPALIKDLIPYLKASKSSLKSSVLEILSKIGKFGKFEIGLLDLYDFLEDNNEDVRKSAVKALLKYYQDNPKEIDLDFIIKKIETDNLRKVKNIVFLLGNLWDHNPDKILTSLLSLFKLDNSELKSLISQILIENSYKKPTLILKKILKIKDDPGFLSRGIISKTAIEIINKDPENNIPLLINNLKSRDPDVLKNTLNSLESLIDDYNIDVEVKSILSILESQADSKIKIKAIQIISKIVDKNPKEVDSILKELLQIIQKLETPSRITLVKSLLDIAKKLPDLIPFHPIIDILKDEEVFVREEASKILGHIGHKSPIRVTEALIQKSLKDDDWGVRDAAVRSLGRLLKEIDDKEKIIKILIEFIDDENKWVRRSVMNLLAEEDFDINLIPYEKIIKNLNDQDSKSREGVANLIKVYGKNNIDEIFNSVLLLLGDNSEEVRRNMINSMVEVIQEIGLSTIISKLLKNLSDQTSLQTQQSIALILERTARYVDEKLKSRVVSLLKVRCEVSQDPIICRVFNKLKES